MYRNYLWLSAYWTWSTASNMWAWYWCSWPIFKQQKRFPCCHSLFNTRRVGRIRDGYSNPRRNAPNLSSVYIRLCKYRKKVFYCFYKLSFLRKNAKLIAMALISYRSRSLVHEVAAFLTLIANYWFNALTVKQWEIAILSRDHYFQGPAMQAMLLFSVANEETPYGQLLHYLHTKSCMCNQFFFCKKVAFQNTDFLA